MDPSTIIPKQNKGYQMLLKMGFQTGTGLGKHSDGIQSPVSVHFKNDRRGFGMDSNTNQWEDGMDIATTSGLQAEYLSKNCTSEEDWDTDDDPAEDRKNKAQDSGKENDINDRMAMSANRNNQFNRESESEEDWDKDEDGKFSNVVQVKHKNTRNPNQTSSDSEDDWDADELRDNKNHERLESLKENIDDTSMACDDDNLDKQDASCSKQSRDLTVHGQHTEVQQDNNGGQMDTELAQSNWSTDDDADDDWDVGIISDEDNQCYF